MSFEEYLAELADMDKRVVVSKLTNLSNLSPEEARYLGKAWPEIAEKRRRQIIYHLSDLAEDNVELDFSGVFRLALEDKEPEVRIKAIEGLAECEERWVSDAFIRLMVGDEDVSVRATAAAALRRFSLLVELEEIGHSRADRIEKALMAIIEDKNEDTEVRRRAIEALSPLSRPHIRQIIQEAYDSDDPRLRASALFAMGQNCDPRWLPTLLKEISSSNAQIRFEAAAALGEIGDKEAAPGLMSLLGDEDLEVRLTAICALGQIGAPEAKDALRHYLKDPDERVRAMAEDALDEISFNEDPLTYGA